MRLCVASASCSRFCASWACWSCRARCCASSAARRSLPDRLFPDLLDLPALAGATTNSPIARTQLCSSKECLETATPPAQSNTVEPARPNRAQKTCFRPHSRMTQSRPNPVATTASRITVLQLWVDVGESGPHLGRCGQNHAPPGPNRDLWAIRPIYCRVGTRGKVENKVNVSNRTASATRRPHSVGSWREQKKTSAERALGSRTRFGRAAI